MNLPTNYLKKNEWIIIGPMGPKLPEVFNHLPTAAVDGGIHFCQEADVWIGDGDSSNKEIIANLKLRFPEKKSTSDLALTLDFFKQLEKPKLHLWGFFGGRSDHFLFNLGECLHFLNDKPDGMIYFYHESNSPKFLLCPSGEFQLIQQGTFSIGSIFPLSITISGDCDYQTSSPIQILPLSSHGLSNIARGEVKISSNAPYFIHLVETP